MGVTRCKYWDFPSSLKNIEDLAWFAGLRFIIIDLKYIVKKSVTNGTWWMHNSLLFGITKYKFGKKKQEYF